MADTGRKPARPPRLLDLECLGQAVECLRTLAPLRRLRIGQMLLARMP